MNGGTAGEGYGRKTRGQGSEESHIGIKERGNGTCESPEQGWGTIGGGRGGKADDQGERQPTVSVWGTASSTGGGLAMSRSPGRRGQFGDALNRRISQAGQHVAEIIADWDLEAAAAFDDR